MSSLPPGTFASLLRRHRQAAGLTQEELAERGDRRAPRKETVNLLAEALSLTEPERATFYAIARQRGQTEQTTAGNVSRADVTLPVLAGEDPDATKTICQQDQTWISPLFEVECTPARRSGRKLSGWMASILMIALLGSAVLLTGEPGVGTLTRLCGGALALATDFRTSGVDEHLGKPVEDAVDLAVMQSRDLGGGYSLKVINYDDESAMGAGEDPTRGASNVTTSHLINRW
ncbi:MAG TPA: hypothetical protein VGP82_14710, partial [Ktedonobacterales bacterium]|nr:hypothetical protein [Ktedonobacterales bacterium]